MKNFNLHDDLNLDEIDLNEENLKDLIENFTNEEEDYSNEEENNELIDDEDEIIAKSADEILFEDFEKKLSGDLEEIEIEEDIRKEVDLSSLPVPLEQAAKDYQNGERGAYDYIYNHYKPKLERLGYRMNNDDLAQELSIVLLRAIETFDDKNGGAKFNTYFWKCAQNHMGTLSIRRKAKKRTAEHGIISLQQTLKLNNSKDTELDVSALIKDPEGEKTYDSSIFNMILENDIFPYLKDNDVQAIKMLLDGHTLEEIGEALGGITAPAVHVKFRRLAEKKHVGKQFKLLYEHYCS